MGSCASSPAPAPPGRPPRSPTGPVGRGPTWALAIGAVAGIALAAWGLLQPANRAGPSPPLGSTVAALVNGRPILRADLERALGAVAQQRKDRLATSNLRRRILGRLIEEELLVQRGLELGLAAHDARVRTDLGAAVIALVTARADDAARPPSDSEVRAFWRANAGYFRRPLLVRVRQLFYAAPSAAVDARALERARAARGKLTRGTAIEALRRSADPPPVPLPSAALPLRRLLKILGPTATRAIARQEIGVTAPVRSRYGYHLFEVLERRGGDLPALAGIRGRVVAELRRRRGDRRLRRFLEERRAAARIRLAADLK